MDLLSSLGCLGNKQKPSATQGQATASSKKKSLKFEPNPTKWFPQQTCEEQRSSDLKMLSSKMDLDAMRANFIKHAGPDEQMDEFEFERFAKAMSITDIAPRLWNAMDSDKSGAVDKDEFMNALHNLTTARAWLRFCPTCMFANDCPMCLKTRNCPDCNDQRFCVRHWSEHPGNPLNMAATQSSVHKGAKDF
ncbi:MAG: hypothetical protein SGPRY_002910 [Prymnesium sp.]